MTMAATQQKCPGNTSRLRIAPGEMWFAHAPMRYFAAASNRVMKAE